MDLRISHRPQISWKIGAPLFVSLFAGVSDATPAVQPARYGPIASPATMPPRAASLLTRPATIRIVLPEPIKMVAPSQRTNGALPGLIQPPIGPTAGAQTAPTPSSAIVRDPAAQDPASLTLAAMATATLPGPRQPNIPQTGPAAVTGGSSSNDNASLVTGSETSLPLSGMSSAALVAPAESTPRPSPAGSSRYKRTVSGLAFQLPASVNGVDMGAVALLIQNDHEISVRLADLIGLVGPMMTEAQNQELRQAAAAQSYVTLNQLRAAGIPVRFIDNDRLVLGHR